MASQNKQKAEPTHKRLFGWHLMSFRGNRKVISVSKHQRELRWFILLVGIVTIMVVTGIVIWKSYVALPPVVINPAPPQEQNLLPPIGTQSTLQSKYHSTSETIQTYRILLACLDENGNTDSMMMLNVNVTDAKLDIISIPRDTYISSAQRDIKRINGAYEGNNIARLKNEIALIMGFEPDYYIIINLEGIEEFVDIIGGVDFDIPINMNYDDPGQNLSIHFKKGVQHLDGIDAVRVMRFRVNNDKKTGYNDYGRMRTQQDFLKASVKQAITIENILELPKLFEIIDKHITSDLTLGQMLALTLEMKKINLNDDISSNTLPSRGEKIDNYSYEIIIEDEAKDMIASVFH